MFTDPIELAREVRAAEDRVAEKLQAQQEGEDFVGLPTEQQRRVAVQRAIRRAFHCVDQATYQILKVDLSQSSYEVKA